MNKLISSIKDDRKTLEIKISDDRLKLFLSISPQNGTTDFTEEELYVAARQVGHEAFFDSAVIRDIVDHLKRGEGCTDRRIAKGRAPEPGLDGRTVWLVKKLGSDSEVQTDARGFADFVQMHLFDNVTVGQKLVRVYRPKPGTPGLDVAGKVLPAINGRPISIRVEPTISIEPQENEGFDVFVAQAAGYVHQQGDTVGIRDTLTISGDLDYHFGSIDFIGNVLVSGDVHKGFSIRSEKNVTVRGSIQGESILWAREGIFVGGTHFGGPKGVVSTTGWYHFRAARGVKADTDGPIVVDREAFDCDLTTRDVLYGPAASIVGGTIRCVRGLEVGHLGNHTGTTTVVHLCVGPEASVEFMKLESEIRRHEEAANLLKLHLGPYASLGIRIDRLNEPQRSRIKALYDKLAAVERSRASLVMKKKQFLTSSVDEAAVVNVINALHVGTVIKRRDVSFVCTETMAGPLAIKFNGERGALETFPIDRLQEPILKQSEQKKSR